jgi:hypothetical protein
MAADITEFSVSNTRRDSEVSSAVNFDDETVRLPDANSSSNMLAQQAEAGDEESRAASAGAEEAAYVQEEADTSKYCESCETYGHTADECDDDQTF